MFLTRLPESGLDSNWDENANSGDPDRPAEKRGCPPWLGRAQGHTGCHRCRGHWNADGGVERRGCPAAQWPASTTPRPSAN